MHVESDVATYMILHFTSTCKSCIEEGKNMLDILITPRATPSGLLIILIALSLQEIQYSDQQQPQN